MHNASSPHAPYYPGIACLQMAELKAPMAQAHHARQFFLRVTKVAVHDGWGPYVLHRRRRHALKRRGDAQWARWRLMGGMVGLLRKVPYLAPI